MVVPDKNTAKSYVLEFLKSRPILDSPHNDDGSFSSKDALIDLPRIFGTPSIIRKCSIDEAKGKVCASLREILRNAYECHMQGCNESKNIQRYHYNTLEFACNSDMCIYVDSTSKKFKIGCLVCNKSALCPDVEGYGSIKEALTNTLRKVGVVHRIAHSAVSWLEGQNNDNIRTFGQTPYRLHLHHLSELNILGVNPCLPDRTKFDSCLGMDQVIVSAIENENANESSIDDIVACWADMCNKYFFDEGSTNHLQAFEANFLYTVENGVASAKTKFLHKLRERDLILMDTGDEWMSEHKLHDCHLINNARYMMKIDWKYVSFPMGIPDDFQLCDSDRLVLNKVVAEETDGIKFFHQTGLLVEYLKQAPEDSDWASIYRELPCVSHRYAFERGNLCKDIFTCAGRQERLPSSTMFVVKSYINNWNESTKEFVKSMLDDESFHVVARTRVNQKLVVDDLIARLMAKDQEQTYDTEQIVGVEVDWVLSDDLENQLHDNNGKWIHSLKHGQWCIISKKVKTNMCQYAKGVLTTYQPISFSVTSLHPYQAMVTYRDMKAASDWFGFAKMQIALANSFYHGSIHHQRAMEIMTNSSFQKPIIHKKVGLKKINQNKSNVSSVDVKWNTGCAIPKTGCPVGISDLIILPHKVETAQWNCFRGNVRNLLAVLNQSNDGIEKGLSSLTRRGDLGSWKGNLVRELSMVFQDVGYHTFLLPNEMDFENLSYYAHLMKLPMVVSMKMSFNDDATKYGHVIGLCPYFSSGCFKLNISIIEGAHPKLQAIEFTKENIRWCCGDESQTKFGGFAFFPGKALSKRFLHNVGQRVNNGLKIVVCLGKNVNGSKHYQELRRQNIVMGDVEYYRKMITPTRNSGSKNSIVL